MFLPLTKGNVLKDIQQSTQTSTPDSFSSKWMRRCSVLLKRYRYINLKTRYLITRQKDLSRNRKLKTNFKVQRNCFLSKDVWHRIHSCAQRKCTNRGATGKATAQLLSTTKGRKNKVRKQKDVSYICTFEYVYVYIHTHTHIYIYESKSKVFPLQPRCGPEGG